MSVQGEINRIKDAVSDSYSAVSDKGGETPTTQNVANLAQAIRSIPTGPDDTKMDKTNPTGTGSFSLNRKADTTVGDYSFAEGNGTVASSENSHAEGYNTTASGTSSHAEGNTTVASGTQSHAEGSGTHASGTCSHAEGTITTARGYCSHAEGYNTKAYGVYQHVQGTYNAVDSSNQYADIVGWGESDSNRKNISALTTGGDLRLKGKVYINCEDDSTGGTEIIDNSVFFAEYNVTTYDQITEAINNGKFVVCVYGNRTYILDNSSANSHYFYAIPKTITNWPGIQCNKTGQYLWQSSIFSTHIESDYNKKTAIDDTTKDSNTYYPTTKAVYDFVNGQKAVFIAEYGVTTYQEILDAYNSGKIVLCRDANKIYQLNSTYGPAIIFSLCYDDVSFNVQCDPDNIWMRIQWALERRTNKTQIISSSSTTSEYPSAKAVYDYIQSLDAREVSY